jgi:tellurite resistance protein
MACVLGGYAVLMAVAQVRLIPVYRRVSFRPGAWTFAFSYAAAAGYTLEWLAIKKPPAATGYAIAAIAALAGVVLAVWTTLTSLPPVPAGPAHRLGLRWHAASGRPRRPR